MMLAAFDTITIEEATERLIDYRGKTPPKTGSGVRLITAKVVKGGQILDDPAEYIATGFYDEWMRRGLPQKLDVLLTTEAPLGEVAILREDERIALAQRIILLRAKPGLIDPHFLFYALQSDFGQGELKARASGTTVLGIKQSELRQVRIPLFPLQTQRRIGANLSAYDELIENSQRRIKILEAIARSLYREWFVHFRFPGHENHPRVASSLGEIPEGWESAVLGQAAVFENGDRGKNYPSGSDFIAEGVPFINAGHLGDGAVDLAKVNCISQEKFRQLCSGKIRDGDLLFCLRGSPGRTARTAGVSLGAIASSLVIIRPTERSTEEFLYYTLSGETGKRMAAELNNGAAQPNLSVGSVQKYPLLVPPQNLLRKFTGFIEPNWRLTDALRTQISILKAQRDLLLPRLLSGQIEVEAA